MSQVIGRISQIVGPVIDVYFDTKGEDPGAALQGKEVYDLNGMRIDSSVLPKGIYIVRDGKTMRKVVR